MIRLAENNELPLLSVCLITYNQKQYVRQAIESIIMQETTFSCEIIIADDGSTDGTREIIEEFVNKYPIKAILQEKNVGAAQNWLDLLNAAKGKFVAYLEGDDYWIDSRKLEKQTLFLDANDDFSICFHDVKYLKGKELTGSGFKFNKDVFDIYDYAKEGFIHSPSLVYRNFGTSILPPYVLKANAGDRIFYTALAKRGLIKLLPGEMAVYRIHDKGVWSMQDKVKLSKKKVNDIQLMLQDETDKKLKDFLKGKLYQEYRFLWGSTKERKYFLKALLMKPVLTIKHSLKKILG